MLALLAGPGTGLAKVIGFEVGKERVQVDLPESWTSVPEIFGLELAFVGPSEAGQRPAVSITDLELVGHSFDAVEQRHRASEYLAGRKLWLGKRDGRLIEAYPVENVDWGRKISGYSMGIRYALGAQEFVERSYVVQCKGRLWHLKTLIPATLESKFNQEASRLVKSFSCDG